MIEITAEIRALIDKAAAGAELAGNEYIDPADGLIHCKKCKGQRQTIVPNFGKPGYFMPRCICQCQREAEEQRQKLLPSGEADICPPYSREDICPPEIRDKRLDI